MPGPIVTTAPYPLAEDVLIAARILANDAALSIAGDILSDSQPYIFPMLQLCYEDLQKRLIRAGVTTYYKYGTVLGLTPVANPNGIADPTIQVQLGYNGYFDGVGTHNPPVLPIDLIRPLELWERQTGSSNAWRPMKQASDSLSTRAQTGAFSLWDWQTDTLYLPGATQSNDLKLKYLLLAPQLVGPNSQVLVVGCKLALAALVCEMAAAARGGLESTAYFHQKAEDHINLLIAPDAIKEQYANFQRKAFRNRGSRRRR